MPRWKSNGLNGKKSGLDLNESGDYAIAVESDFNQTDLANNGKANQIIYINNDTRKDGDNVVVLTIEEPTVPAAGYSQAIYIAEEKKFGQFNSFSATEFPVELVTSSQAKTAVILIVDDDMPNRRTTGTNQNDTITKSDTKNDTIFAGEGNDTVDAGKGNDNIFGGAGNDRLQGGQGTDFLSGGKGKDKLIGGDNNDLLLGDEGNDILDGGKGSDTLDGGSEIDTLKGGTGNDIYVVDNPNDIIIDSPGTGIETVESSVTWTLNSGLDNLTLSGFEAINGTGNNLNNEITGNNRDNVLSGLGGNDTLFDSGGNNTLMGGEGNDTLTDFFGNGNNILMGGEGNDNLSVQGNGINILIGGEGNDNLSVSGSGFGGNFTLIGDVGNDTLTGGDGIDIFLFNSLAEGVDIIQNLSTFDDKIQISSSGFGASSTDQFSYDPNTGALSFDASPFDTLDLVQFATLPTGLSNFNPSLNIQLV